MMIQIYFILNIGLIILSVAQLVTTVIFFSARDKSRVKWAKTQSTSTTEVTLVPRLMKRKMMSQEIKFLERLAFTN